jgi:anti-sigma B factor antagonist
LYKPAHAGFFFTCVSVAPADDFTDNSRSFNGSPRMNVAARRFANAVVLRVDGRLDQETCETFRAELSGFVSTALRDHHALVIDLSQLEYVSSAGLRCLLMASRQMKAGQGRILVAELQPMVAEIFEISHFDLVFEIFAKVSDALAAVSGEAAAAFERG